MNTIRSRSHRSLIQWLLNRYHVFVDSPNSFSNFLALFLRVLTSRSLERLLLILLRLQRQWRCTVPVGQQQNYQVFQDEEKCIRKIDAQRTGEKISELMGISQKTFSAQNDHASLPYN